jgi:tripartite-type tricarboxylate transporter receptor subunit TctC
MLEVPELRQRLIDQGADPASSTPEELAALVRTDLARWTKVVQTTGIGKR